MLAGEVAVSLILHLICGDPNYMELKIDDFSSIFMISSFERTPAGYHLEFVNNADARDLYDAGLRESVRQGRRMKIEKHRDGCS
jgi:hypothetical protein